LETEQLHNKYDIKFDVPKMFMHFGGVVEVERLLRESGLPVPPMKTLQKQRERANAPADMIATLLFLSYRVNMPMRLEDFLIKREGR
jgi:hypothetical protein